MNILIDTREQKPLSFTGHKTTRRKLDEGDYNVQELLEYIVIERKTLGDLYGSIIQDHQRFKNEIIRSRQKGKIFYIFLEGTLEDFYFLKWSTRPRGITPQILRKIIMTMTERYNIRFMECETRGEMSRLIVLTLQMNKIKQGDDKHG